MIKTTVTAIQALMVFVGINVADSYESQIAEKSIFKNSRAYTNARSLDDVGFLDSRFDFLVTTRNILKEKEEEEAKRIEAEIQMVTEANNQKNNVNFNPYNLREVSGITADELDQVFILKEAPEMCKLTQAIVDAEALYKVNALFLAGLVAQESGWGKKPAGNGTNYTGYAVYSSYHEGAQFDSVYQNIIDTAELISNSYLDPNGPYYNGVSIWDVNTRYCLYNDMQTTDYNWSESISRIAYDFNYTYHEQVKVLEEVPTRQ